MGYAVIICGFHLRTAVALPRARVFMVYYAQLHGLSCLFLALAALTGHYQWLIVYSSLVLLQDPLMALLCDGLLSPVSARVLDIPVNIEYVITRQNELYIEALGVAVIVPNALFPTSPSMLMSLGAAAVVALSLKVQNRLHTCDHNLFKHRSV
jgi:hypothetical protein